MTLIPNKRLYLYDDFYLHVFMAHKRANKFLNISRELQIYKDQDIYNFNKGFDILSDISISSQFYKNNYIDKIILTIELYDDIKNRADLYLFGDVLFKELSKKTITPKDIKIIFNTEGETLVKGKFYYSDIDITKNKNYINDTLQMEFYAIYT